jgi:hypothetical protein
MVTGCQMKARTLQASQTLLAIRSLLIGHESRWADEANVD